MSEDKDLPEQGEVTENNVVPLRIFNAEYEEESDVVEELEQLLEDAKSGKIVGLLYVTKSSNRERSIGSCGDWDSVYGMLGAAQMLCHRLANYIEDYGYEEED